MDIDHDEKNRRRYKTGNLLRDVPRADRITAIWNEENLDEVMARLGYGIDTSNKRDSYSELSWRIDPLDFYRRLRATHGDGPCTCTNMEVLVRTILETQPAYQSRLDRRCPRSPQWNRHLVWCSGSVDRYIPSFLNTPSSTDEMTTEECTSLPLRSGILSRASSTAELDSATIASATSSSSVWRRGFLLPR